MIRIKVNGFKFMWSVVYNAPLKKEEKKVKVAL